MLSFSNFLRRALVASKSKYVVDGYDKAVCSPLVPLNSCYYRSGITHNTEIRADRGQNVSLCFGWLESLEVLDNGDSDSLAPLLTDHKLCKKCNIKLIVSHMCARLGRKDPAEPLK